MPAAASTVRIGEPNHRMRVVLLVVLFVITLFAGRLFQLQGLDSASLAATAESYRLREVALPATRGDILAADGTVLATTAARYDITADQRLVADYTVGRGEDEQVLGARGVAQRLAPILDADVAELTTALDGDKPFAYVARTVTPETWRQVQTEVAEAGISGILAEDASQRVYPAGSAAGSLTGFMGSDDTPLAGLEQMYADELSGTDGSRRYEVGADGRQLPMGQSLEKPPVAGSDVQLTIDPDLQWKAQQALEKQVSLHKAESGSAVAIDIRTGAILALASAPTLDPNKPGDADESARMNRALTDSFEPGSTSKVMTIAAAMEEEIVTPESVFSVSDRLKRSVKTFKDSHDHPVEQLTTAGILAESSNVGTILIGEQVPQQTMHDYLVKFGIGQPSELGFPGESRGILADVSDWDSLQPYTILFGQGVATTALQVAGVYQTMGNNGVRVPPHLVQGVTDADGTKHPVKAPEASRVVREKTADSVVQMMESVVGEDGTAPEAAVEGYRVAGKTGTAQFPDPECGCYRGYTASFAGLAPADDPQIAIAVMIHKPSEGGYYGGTVAAPAFSELMTYALANRGIAPSGTPAPNLRLRADG